MNASYDSNVNIQTFIIILPPSAPPKLTMENKYKDGLIMKANTSAILEIPFTGSPQPSVSWTFNGGALPDARRAFEETIYNMTCLTLNRVRMSDKGNYSLTLENPSGKVSLTVKVTVIGECFGSWVDYTTFNRCSEAPSRKWGSMPQPSGSWSTEVFFLTASVNSMIF